MEGNKPETNLASPALEVQQGELPEKERVSEQQEESPEVAEITKPQEKTTLQLRREKERCRYIILPQESRKKKKRKPPDAALGLASPGAGVFQQATDWLRLEQETNPVLQQE